MESSSERISLEFTGEKLISYVSGKGEFEVLVMGSAVVVAASLCPAKIEDLPHSPV